MFSVSDILSSSRSNRWKEKKLREKEVYLIDSTLDVSLKDKLWCADFIGGELSLKKAELAEVREIILRNKDFKKLCGNCSEEQIVAILCLRTKRRHNKKSKIDRYGLWNRYSLTWKIYSLVSDRVGYSYQKKILK
jgi:hypothetical protein